MNTQRPDIFKYQDYVEFFKDWLAFKKSNRSELSLRQWARQAGLATGYLSMVLARKRSLSQQALIKLVPHLGLTVSEQAFLEKLVLLGTSVSHDAKVSSLEGMQRFTKFKKLNSQNSETYKYQSHWYFIAIREMSALSDFQLDPRWIQARLIDPVPLKDIKKALSFLLEKGYIQLGPGGAVLPPEARLEAHGELYRVALTKFHRAIFNLAAKSIENTPSEQRKLLGHTLAMNEGSFQKARAILDKALQEIRDLDMTEDPAEKVYHLELALFPLTDPKRSAK